MAALWLDGDRQTRIVHLGSGSGSMMTCVLADIVRSCRHPRAYQPRDSAEKSAHLATGRTLPETTPLVRYLAQMADSIEAGRPDAGTPPMPDRDVLLWRTDWTALTHACGSADDIPAALSQLTHEEPDVRAKALQHLERVNHQNSVYPATAPVAMYIAAILSDRWTIPAITARYPTWRTEYRSLRAVLLDWLGDMAGDAGDEAGRLARAHGVPMDDAPEVIALRAARPTIFAAVVPFLTDEDLDVRQSAVIAAAQLLDAPELIAHRASLIAPLRDVLANCPDKYHRAAAKRALVSWGEDPATLLESAGSPADTKYVFARFPPRRSDLRCGELVPAPVKQDGPAASDALS